LSSFSKGNDNFIQQEFCLSTTHQSHLLLLSFFLLEFLDYWGKINTSNPKKNISYIQLLGYKLFQSYFEDPSFPHHSNKTTIGYKHLH